MVDYSFGQVRNGGCISLEARANIPIPGELVIIPNLEIKAIINDKSLV